MALNRYRVWQLIKPGEVKYTQLRDMGALVKWARENKSRQKWGIDKFDSTQNIWVDAFYSADLVAMYLAMQVYAVKPNSANTVKDKIDSLKEQSDEAMKAGRVAAGIRLYNQAWNMERGIKEK